MTPAAAARARAARGEGERLHDEILDATERLIARAGDHERVSIRAICKEVGVTPPSIYLHFADKDELIMAVCARAFARFDDVLGAAEAGATDPLDALRRRGRAYVRFGLEHPEAYRVIFMSRHDHEPDADGAVFDPSHIPGMDAFHHQLDAVVRAIEGGHLRADLDPFLVATGLWTTMHGVTSLLIAMPRFPWPESETLAEHVCNAQLLGLVDAEVHPPAPTGS